MTYICPVHHGAKVNPNEIALITSGAHSSYLQLDKYLQSFSNSLPDLLPGTPVALISEAKEILVLQVLACWRRGYVPVPLDHRLPLPAIEELCQRMHWHRLGEETEPGSKGKQYPENRADWSDILLTSGSMGEPKGVIHTFGNHQASAEGLWQCLAQLGAGAKGAKWLLSLPLFHIAGFSLIWRVLRHCATLVAPDQSEPLHKQLTDGVTHASLVPAQVLKLPDPPPSPPLKVLMLGGEAVSHIVAQRAQGWAEKVVISYGCSEMCSTVGLALPEERFRLLEGRNLFLRDEELVLAGKTLSPGYYTAQGVEPIPQGGLFSGDLGTLHKGDHFTIIGRKGRRFISGGENIQPEQIEQALLNLNGVVRALVVPIPHPVFGHRPAAFVLSETSWLPENWAEQLSHILPKFMVPELWLHWPDRNVLKPPIVQWQRLAESLAKPAQ